MKFRNVCPNGARMIPALDELVVEAGGIVEVSDEFGAGMVGQVDVWQLVTDDVKPAKPGKEGVK